MSPASGSCRRRRRERGVSDTKTRTRLPSLTRHARASWAVLSQQQGTMQAQPRADISGSSHGRTTRYRPRLYVSRYIALVGALGTGDPLETNPRSGSSGNSAEMIVFDSIAWGDGFRRRLFQRVFSPFSFPFAVCPRLPHIFRFACVSELGARSK